MIFQSRFLSRFSARFSVCALAVLITAPALAANVQTYGVTPAQPMPLPSYERYDSPLKAGQLTLQDVLNAHKPKKPPVTTTVSPSVRSSTATSANIMLQEGLQSVLRQPSTGKPVKLQAPQLEPASGTTSSVSGTATLSAPRPVDMQTSPSVKYEPGEQPKNLAGEIQSPKTATTSFGAAAQETLSEAPMPKPAISSSRTSSVVSSVSSSGGCEEQVENWTKNCSEAGYPETFVGKIVGETRTTCPDGALQDVWVANSCAPPGEDNVASIEEAAPAPQPKNTKKSTAAVNAAAQSIVQNNANSTVRADASCGPANGLAASSAPYGDLCVSGESSEVSGDGPWRWNCKGIKGGMTVSCAAPVSAEAAANMPKQDNAKRAKSPNGLALEDGVCGSADGSGTDRAPAANLCARGMASKVNGSGPWTWACSGENGGQAAACSASRKVDGACGSSGKTGSDQMPSENLCASGYASAVTGDGPWNWTCSGLYGGNPVTCSAAIKRDAVCGSASMSGHRETPKDSLCSIGDAGSVRGSGPWNWTCAGINGGATVSCTASMSTDGLCGGANGVAVTHAPKEDLCTRGTATRVVGSGPWDWNCTGSEGGNTQSCTAPLATKQSQAPAHATEAPVASAVEAPVAPTTSLASAPPAVAKSASLCGSAAELMALEAPDKDLCASGKASDVSGNGPWNWTCDEGGRVSNCSTLSPTGSFGASSKAKSSAAKAKSEAKAVTMPSSDVSSSVSAPAPVMEDKTPICGQAAGQGATAAPVESLCSTGKPSAVKGSGPWKWTCLSGKAKINCEAPRLQDGTCGPANGSVQKYIPSKGLCSDGTSTQVEGNGPWLWSCVGSGGGASSSCSASTQSQTRIDGSCGVAANAPQTGAPEANLCDSGVASNVYGDGPWTWTCSGLNGGIAASCSARKDMPAAPPPPGPSVNGLCGNSNGVAMVAEPVEELCSSGTPTAVSGNGPWNWNCLGSNSGMTVSCTAPLQPPAPITGVCGSANGVTTLTMPRSGLCSAGISSAVSGKGPWTWSCSGTNGGGAVGCVAPLAGGSDTGALPSLSTPGNEAPAPIAAPTHSVTSGGLVTPKLQPSGTTSKIKPLKTPAFQDIGTPQPSKTPPAPDMSGAMIEAPSAVELQDEASGINPPPIRDNLPPSPALKPPAIDNEGAIVPGNRFKLSSDVSSVPFNRNSENINRDETSTLDKLAAVMEANGGVRVTLTAYADNSYGMSPREARRLSLRRALAIRDYLTAKGISSARIDVRALGANMQKDAPQADRVDITAN